MGVETHTTVTARVDNSLATEAEKSTEGEINESVPSDTARVHRSRTTMVNVQRGVFYTR